jgi:hypothetical protein
MVTSRQVMVSFPRTPIARNDLAEREVGQPVTIPIADLLANDTNPIAGPLVVLSELSSSFGNAFIDGANVRFEPDPFFPMPVTGSFEYTVRNDSGNTAPATVTVLVRDPTHTVAGSLSGATVVAENELQLNFAGTPGRNYVIQTAAALDQPNWVTLATVTADAQGNILFTPPGGLQPAAFFLVHPVY